MVHKMFSQRVLPILQPLRWLVEWYEVRVLQPGSAQVLRITEKCKRGVLHWNKYDAEHLLVIDFPFLEWAPQSGVASSNPRQHLHIPDWRIVLSLPDLPLTHGALYL